MASTIDRTVSKTKSSTELPYQSIKTTSVDSLYTSSDPDLLIREYFLASHAQRAKLRKLVFQNTKSLSSILAILKWSRNKEVSDAYDGASDLLAECTDISLLQDAIQYLEAASLLISSSSNGKLSNLDDFWEVLLRGLSYSHQIPAKDRFQLILNLFAVSNTRIFKASIIDALIILSEGTDMEPIKDLLSRFSCSHEPDLYIRNYAEEALQEIS